MSLSRTLLLAALATGATSALAQPVRDLSKGNTLYVVPYSHLDTQWRWAYPQVIREYVKNTLVDNFRLIERYPNYVFNFSGSRRYEFMKEYFPAEYDQMKAYVKAGRWFPCGSSVDESDANVPSGEALIRQVLYGNAFFRRELGVASEEFMLPDCFGFPYALPSILAHCGLKGFSTQKLTWGSSVGIPFKVGVWEGPDGRSVVAALDPGSYAADVTQDLSESPGWLARIQNTGKQSGAFVDYHYYGTGDIGGAPREAAVQWVERSIAGKGPVTVVSSKADEMFRSLTPAQVGKLPRFRGELLLTEHSAGSITSQAYMKRWNRKSELLADSAEKASVAAYVTGSLPYPSQRLYRAWDLVLGSQMHDMLPGTSIPKAYEFCWNDYLLALNQFAAMTTDAVGALAAQMDTRGPGQPVVVYNPLSIERTDVVELTDPALVVPGSAVTITGPNGATVPSQAVGGRRIFQATVPPCGFAVYHVGTERAGRTVPELKVSASSLENDRFRVTVNAAGDIASIFDKQAKREVLKAPAQLHLQYHNPSAFPAWNMDWEDARKGPTEVVGGPAKVRIVENGPVRIALEVEREAKGSKFVQHIRLTKGGQTVEVLNKIDWQTRERALKAAFPLVSANPEATYELQVGTIRRGNNDPKMYEVPQHQWLDLTDPGGTYGTAILNDSKFGSDKPSDDTVRLTLIYTPGVRGGYEDQATQDFGRHEILYAIAPHAGDWRKGNVNWEARRLNQPLHAFAVPAHAGPRGKQFSIVRTSSAQVEIQALKKAEDRDEVIVRLRELNGLTAKGVRVLFGWPVVSAREVDGQERSIGRATLQNGALVTDVDAYSLRSFAVKLRAETVPASASQPIPLDFDADVMSTDAKPADGEMFDGHAYPAEMVPPTIEAGGVTHRLGSGRDGAKNALTARGQSLAVPQGYGAVSLLVAAKTPATVRFGDRAVSVGGWYGFIGLWDNRSWAVDPGPNFSNYGDTMNGLAPGWRRNEEVAWFATHRHTRSGNTYYDFPYLYRVTVPVAGGRLTLPNDPSLRVFAATAVKRMPTARPAAPLYDTMEEHRAGGAPTVAPGGGRFRDSIEVTITPPLYWQAGRLHYTLDGSVPTTASPVYRGPFRVSQAAEVRAVQLDANGKASEAAMVRLEVEDTTAPRIVSASSVPALGLARVVLSEPVDRVTAERAASYQIPGVRTTAAKLMADGRTVELSLDESLTAGSATIRVSGVADLAPKANVVQAEARLVERGAVFSSGVLEPKTPRVFNSVPNLPVKAGQPFTLNLFCRMDGMPDDRTLIAGFGRSTDGRTGTGRYFSKFPRGINFWAANRDVMSSEPLDVGRWQMLTASYDGITMRLYKNGRLIAAQVVAFDDDVPQVRVMPLDAWERRRKFDGEVRDLTVWDIDLPEAAIKRLWGSWRP